MEFVQISNTDILQFKSFPKDKLFNFSTTIKGGLSKNSYESLNLGLNSGDDLENVYENRRRLAEILNISNKNLYIPYQTHDDKICIVDENFLELSDEEKTKRLKGIDAIITDRKNIGIGITTADCVPILIFDPTKNIFAAVHAGWKGTAARIAAKTVEKMHSHFNCKPQDLIAGIGPCISQSKFEVGEEVVDCFRQADFPIDIIGYHNSESGKLHIDLELTNRLILEEAGIIFSSIETANLCTYSNPDKFFSARRQTIYSGRMITGGVLI